MALTASVLQADRARFDDAGFAGLIAKPIDVMAFPEQVLAYWPTDPSALKGPDMADPSKILVVDDTAQNRRLMEAVLTPLGHTVTSAESGPEALEMIAADPPDLVLLDVVMPEMDGYAVCQAFARTRIPRCCRSSCSPPRRRPGQGGRDRCGCR